MAEAVIIDAIRTPFGRRKGALREVRPDSLLASTLQQLLQRNQVAPDKIEDVVTVVVQGLPDEEEGQAGEELQADQTAVVARDAELATGAKDRVQHRSGECGPGGAVETAFGDDGAALRIAQREAVSAGIVADGQELIDDFITALRRAENLAGRRDT